MKYMYHPDNHEPPIEVQPDGKPLWIYVYESNLAGNHKHGSALTAYKYYGARPGVGCGREGRSYGIPTTDEKYRQLSINSGRRTIQGYVNIFKAYVQHRMEHAHEQFWITDIGLGSAGLSQDHREQIVPLFRGIAGNCSFPLHWFEYLEPEAYAARRATERLNAAFERATNP